jgi:hypothetical protein
MLLDILEDPALRDKMVFYPERHYVRNPATGRNMRVWSELETGDDWWNIQVFASTLPKIYFSNVFFAA